MTQIDFYILDESSPKNLHQIVCRLCEKALSQKMKVVIYTESIEQAQQLDDLLWSYKPDSFIAHQNRFNESVENDVPQANIPQKVLFNYPVLISNEEQLSTFFTGINQEHWQYTQLLINLSTNTPPYYQRFDRLAEMVEKDAKQKEVARNRYRNYRQQGYSLNKYDL
jgi:DNA polymerase III subunit chi